MDHGVIRNGVITSQRDHSYVYAVVSLLAAILLGGQTQSIIVTGTGFHVT